jgi:hypothetical protein
MKTIKNTYIEEDKKICQLHVDRINTSLHRISHLFPIDTVKIDHLTDEEFAFIDVLMNRFGKLQDILVSKFFPKLLNVMNEFPDGPTFIDLLNHLEKIEIIKSVEFWKETRRMRNFVTHEYPENPDLRVEHLNQIYTQTLKLLKEWDDILNFINTKNIT